MKSFVITKATPINLRSCYLNLSGIPNMGKDTLVECTNFDSSSTEMFNKLASKFEALVLPESQILTL